MPFELEVHPPERRKRSLVLACGGCGCGCCCCCCCCLHSVGGLVGSKVPSIVMLVRGAPARAAGKTYLRCKKCQVATSYGAEAIQSGTVTCPTCGTVGKAPEVKPLEEVDPVTRAAEARSRRIAVGYFWSVGIVLALAHLVFGMEGAFALAIDLPFVQLVAGLAALLAIALTPRALVPRKKAACGAVGWLLLGLFIGTAIGAAILVPILGIWAANS